MKNSPKQLPRYAEIAHALREEIVKGRYGNDGRMPSEAQLVKRYKVSRPTVAKALKVLCDEGMVVRRAGSGSYVKEGTKVNIRSTLMALLIPDLGNTEIFQVIGGEISSLARMHDYGLVWGGSEPEVSTNGQHQIESLCKQFIERNVAGVFFAPYEIVEGSERVNHSVAMMLRDAGIPVVLLDRDFTSFPMRSDFDLVGIDNFAAGYMLAEHLFKLGCTSIHFLTRPHSAPTVEARIAGVREAYARHQIETPKNWIRIGMIEDKKFIRDISGLTRPDAFICANDHTAAHLMCELQRINIRVPQDVRVVGFDDVKLASLVSPPLTTIHQPCRELAQTAFRAMVDRLGDVTLPSRKQVLAPRLVIRESCGAYLPHSS
ncbi:MAG: GntR family transcriptional regulator [Akkermansiaceae bacterium]|nr:GntR family transcriptional regulator [Akkermansiaceae bacterium]